MSGPAYALGLRITNRSGKRINLRNAVVTIAYGADATPGSPISGPPNKPLSGLLASGATANGVYVFTVPANNTRAKLTVDVSYSPYAPVVVFSGYTG